MNSIVSILFIASPLLLITLGALISEYAGRLAMFMECVIGIGGFFCYAFSVLTGSVFWGTIFSVLISTALTFLLERISTKLNSNMFLIALAMNLIFSSVTTLISAQAFGTRGVLYSAEFSFSPAKAKIVTTIICFILSFLFIIFLRFTTPGLRLRITGSDSAVLKSQGISSDKYKCLSWLMAAFCGSFAGCVYAIRLSSYVPGLSGGRGWTALAAFFLGRKNPLIVVIAVLVFSVAEYASSNIQNINIFSSVPSSVLLALPYLISILMIIVVPQKKDVPNAN